MTSVFGRSRMFLGLVGLVSALTAGASAAPIASLEAVKINGSTIANSNSISVNAGDTITAEIFASDWNPSFLHAFQFDINRVSFESGTRGSITPLGWDRPATTDINCPTGSADCPAEFPNCSVVGGPGVCLGTNYSPEQGVFIECGDNCGTPVRPDWVFTDPDTGLPLGGFVSVDTSGVSIRYGGIVFPQSDSPAYNIPPKYCATLKLQVSDDACGQFVIRFPLGSTSLTDSEQLEIPGLIRRGLTINVSSPGAAGGECSCLNILSASVPNCAIDARQPKNPDGSNPQTPKSITMTFDCSDTTDIASTSNFAFAITPGGFGPFISSVASNGSDVTVNLNAPMVERKWNCFTFSPTGKKICLGVLPGDVNADSRTFSFNAEPDTVSDLDALVACLNAPGSCSLLQCDSDRSGSCGPQDLLREIDMLVGAGAFTPYDGKGILDFAQQPVACPSAP